MESVGVRACQVMTGLPRCKGTGDPGYDNEVLKLYSIQTCRYLCPLNSWAGWEPDHSQITVRSQSLLT